MTIHVIKPFFGFGKEAITKKCFIFCVSLGALKVAGV